MTTLFRKEAMDQLQSPDDLSSAIQLTRPRTWLAVCIIATIIIVVALWGVLGSIPMNVAGLGSFLHRGGDVYNVISRSAGRVQQLAVGVGDQVTKGERIAELNFPEKESKRVSAKKTLRTLHERYQRQQATTQALIAENEQDTKTQNRSLKKHLRSLRQQLGYLKQLLAIEEKELKKGYVVRQQVESTRSSVFSAEQSIRDATNQLSNNETQLLEFKNTSIRNLAQLKQQVVEAEGELNQIEIDIRNTLTVYSPFDGTVTGVAAMIGDWVDHAQTIVTIEQSGQDLTLYAYFQISAGKKIAVGMPAEVAPSSVERSLYGSIIGRVESVSALPVSRASLLSIMGNVDVVKEFLAEGPPIQARISLEQDPKTFSGFKWSSSQGPRYRVTPGELASVTVTVREKKPIEFVIPLIKAWEKGG